MSKTIAVRVRKPATQALDCLFTKTVGVVWRNADEMVDVFVSMIAFGVLGTWHKRRDTAERNINEKKKRKLRNPISRVIKT